MMAAQARPGVATKIFFDGGCRPVPIGMETAVVVAGVAHIRDGLGEGSSMVAEWLALIDALVLARSREIPHFVLLGDALAVIEQATGKVRCRALFRPYRDRFIDLAGQGPRPRIRYIRRAHNLAGIALAKRHHP